MPRKPKKEDKKEGGLNVRVIKGESEDEKIEEPAVSAEETVLFLKKHAVSACPEPETNDKPEDGYEDWEDDEPGSRKKRKLSIMLRTVVFLLMVAAVWFGLKLANKSGYSACLSDNGVNAGNCGVALQKLEDDLVIDKTRLADAGSIIAGLQKYSVEKRALPENLSGLLSGGYIPKAYSDPEFDKPYFYKKQNNTSYSFCVYLSSGAWGVNPAGCPSKESYLSGISEEETTPTPETRTVTVQETSIGWLNVRQSPTTDSTIITKAYAGEQYRVLEEKGDWLRIPLKSSVLINGEQVIEGWVYKSYVK
ncbi:MAG TPA: SH3 domain-containing protein [Candidatus Colwellbacteria bacterium]|nr:SH3 domain-containing protein [Candidatus Colwellbacteria bacterium]